MSKPAARRAMPCPIRPMPRIPSVARWMSPPSSDSKFHCRQWPSRSHRSASVMRRAAAIIRAKPKSAVVSVSTSGVLVTRMPASLIARTSRLL
jgi:hypothetical protein